MQKIILASGSANRQAVLKQARIPFEAFPAEVDEKSVQETDFSKRAEKIAELKARWVAARKSSIIVAADTFEVYDNHVLGKPKDKDEAVKMLRLLSGKVFTGYTGFFCINTRNNKTFAASVSGEIEFRDITEAEIKDSVENEPVTTWAAGYSLTYSSIKFVKRLNGSLSGLMYGLPLELLNKALLTIL